MTKFNVCIDVDDVDRAVKFYGEGLGLKVARHEPEWAQIKVGGQTFWIMKIKSGRDGKIRRDYRRHWTPVHLDFVVPDIRRAVKRAVAAGGKLEGKLRRSPMGALANLADPSGNGLDLFQPAKKRSK